MRRIAILASLTAALTAALAACGHSPPTRFFTLDPAPAAGVAARSASAPVQLGAVRIPAGLDRPEMVSETAPDRLRIDDQDHWGAPLGDLVRQALAQDLKARLADGALIAPGAPRPAGARVLAVDILAFQPGPDGQVRLEASWSLMSGSPLQTTLSRQVTLTASPPSGGAGGQAAAMSDLLGRLSDRIAAVLAST